MGSGYVKLACFVRTATLVALVSTPVLSAAPSKSEVLKRAAGYVETQIALLPQLVAEERSTQRFRPRVRGDVDPILRNTHSDFAWVKLEGMREALGVREVVEVDGKAVGTGEMLQRLLRSPAGDRRALVQYILDQSATHNLAPGSRNFNIPTFALFVLLRDMQPRFSWRHEPDQSSGAFVVSFKEQERPTYIRGPGNQPVFSRGRIWIEPATGVVTRTELRAQVHDVGDDYYATYFLAVDFAIDQSLGLTLPRRMLERYETRAAVVTGQAEYVNYRRFQTEGRIVR